MDVVYDLRGPGVQSPVAGRFFNFKFLKWLKIGTKHLKMLMSIYTTTLPQKLLRAFFEQEEPVPPLTPHKVVYALSHTVWNVCRRDNFIQCQWLLFTSLPCSN